MFDEIQQQNNYLSKLKENETRFYPHIQINPRDITKQLSTFKSFGKLNKKIKSSILRIYDGLEFKHNSSSMQNLGTEGNKIKNNENQNKKEKVFKKQQPYSPFKLDLNSKHSI